MAYKRRSPQPIAEGGTNAISMTNTDGVCYFDGTLINTTAVGTAGQVLTSNGAAMAPTFQAAGSGGITTIDGDTGSVTGSTVSIKGQSTAGASVVFTGSVAAMTLHTVDANNSMYFGGSAGNISATATGNVAIGFDSMNQITSGNYNVGIGHGSLNSITTATENIAIGRTAGANYATAETGNILIGYRELGTTGESGILRIGVSNGLSASFIGGIYGVAPGAADQVLAATSGNQITGIAAGTSGYVLTSGGAGVTPSWQAASGGISTIDGNSGSVTGSTVTIKATDGSSAFTGSGATLTQTFTSTDGNFNTLLGSRTNIASVSGSANTSVGDFTFATLTSGSDNCAFGQSALAALSSGGHNTAYGLQSLGVVATGSYNCGFGYNAGVNYSGAESSNICINNNGTASESNILRIGAGTGSGTQQIAQAYISGIYGNSPATAQMVIINSSDQLGTQAIPSAGISTIDGDSGSVTGSTVSIKGNGASGAGSSVSFSGSGTALSLNITDGGNNVIMGFDSGNSSISGSGNTGVGTEQLSSLTSGNYNNILGIYTALNITSGSNNIVIGARAGENWTSSESNNIYICSDGAGTGSRGTTGDNNVLRIGTGTGTGAGNLNAAYISGIYGASPASPQMVTINSSNQLGSQAIPAASSSVIGCTNNVMGNAGAVSYTGFYQNGIVTASLSPVYIAMPAAGTITNLTVYLSSNSNTNSGTFTLYQNGSTTSLVATAPATTTGVFTDNTHSVSVAASDLICIQVSQIATGTMAGSITVTYTP